jgi:hypothetical protein
MKRESTAVDVLVSKLEAKGLDLSDCKQEVLDANALFKVQILDARLALADELSTNPRGLSKEDKEQENEVSEHYYLLTYGNGTE